ncbi:MAG TPA: hypothetical protein VIG93_06245 [Gaiellaceae bacterium]
MSVASTSYAAAREAGRTIDRLLERPRAVLGGLIVAQIGATLVLALTVTHNGWVYFQGGDQIVNTTTAWLIGGLEIPPTEVGYVWPLVLAPITWVTGATFVQALPAIVLLNVLILGPIALFCVYSIADHIGGRLVGYWAAALWVVAPYAAIPLFVDRYHEKWVDQFLPQALGLTAMPDFPSLVLVLAAALFVVRSLSPDRVHDALLAGLLAGAAGGLKPPNYLFVFGAVLAYPLARRWREAVAFGIALAPSILLLAFWKERGLGYIPALALEQVQLAAGSAPLALDLNLGRYVDLDLEHWRVQMDELREFFWSPRLAQFVPFAGFLAVLRMRRYAIAGLLAGWLAAFLVVKGFSPRASIEANTFWRLLMPAWPAYLLLFASIPLLVPTLARRLGDRVQAPRRGPVDRRWLVVAAVATLAVPVAVTAAAARIEPPTPAIVQPTESETTILTPVDEGIELQIEREGASQRLSWTPGSWRAGVFYRVYRKDGPGEDTQCALSEGVAWSCFLLSTPIATTRETTFVDPSPPPDGATYRIGVGTNWADDPELGDVFDFTPPVPAAR